MAVNIDDPNGNIVAGGEDSDGDVVLRSGAGQDRIRLDADGANAWLGGNGADGDIVLFPSNGDNTTLSQATIHLDGQTGDVRLKNRAGQDRIRLDAEGANAWLGGNGADGDIVLKNGSGQDRIRLDADGANAWFGGNGADGDIVLFPSNGDNTTLSQATIHLDGQTGDIRLSGADCAELFDVANHTQIAPGSVLVLGDSGELELSRRDYDTRVAGVVSGAKDFRPGVILDHRRVCGLPVALVGKVWCWVDASESPVNVGDLLTTSKTPGHAMRATSRELAFGAVLGKAMLGLQSGRALLPILVSLQ